MAETRQNLGPCAWCGKPAVDQVIVRPGRKLRKTALVCKRHRKQFVAQGADTIEHELHRKMESARKRAR